VLDGKAIQRVVPLEEASSEELWTGNPEAVPEQREVRRLLLNTDGHEVGNVGPGGTAPCLSRWRR